MISLHLSAENAADRSSLHTAFAQAFSLPDWYGRNLDALSDCLTDFSEDAEISMDEDALLGCLGDRYVAQLKRLFSDVSAHNPHIRFAK